MATKGYWRDWLALRIMACSGGEWNNQLSTEYVGFWTNTGGSGTKPTINPNRL